MSSEAPSVSARRPAATLAIFVGFAVLVSFFYALGRTPLFDVDEGAFSQATVEMFQRNDFLSTYLNGEPRYDKPILIYWLQAFSVKILGVREFAFRFPSALCATGWVFLVYVFSRRRYGVDTALLAAAITAMSLGVYIIGRAATADALLNMLIAAAMFAAWLRIETGRKLWLYVTFAAIAFGFLAKGPVAILIPGSVTLVFCILRRDFKTWARMVFDPLGLLLFAAIALPWYAIILQREGWAFIEGFFVKHNLSRFSGPLQGHAGSLLYYFPVVLIGTLPFTSLLLPLVKNWRTIWRDDLQCYLLLWFAFVFLFFSLSGTKLPHYILYGMSGLFILMALYGSQLRSVFVALAPALLFFLFLSALPAIVSAVLPHLPDDYYREALADAGQYFTSIYYVYAATAAGVTLWLMMERRLPMRSKLVAVGLIAVIALSSFVIPFAGNVQQQPIKEAALLSRTQHYDVVMWRLNAPSFSVYYGRPTPSHEPRHGDVIITKMKRLAQLEGLQYQVLYAKNGIVLARID